MNLNKTEILFETKYVNKKVYFHNEHRFALSIAKSAQDDGILPIPSTLILFDMHNDMRSVLADEELDLVKDNISLDISDFCNEKLSKFNNDWIKAGFELGVFDDAILFGLALNQTTVKDTYYDKQNRKHIIKPFSGFPSDLLKSSGPLCDLARSDENTDLWNILNWDSNLNFINENVKFFVTIDLDCFTICHKEEITPWHDKLFRKKFINTVSYDWSGNRFMQELFKRAGLISIAIEPDYLDDEENKIEIIKQVNKYIFNNEIEGLKKVFKGI